MFQLTRPNDPEVFYTALHSSGLTTKTDGVGQLTYTQELTHLKVCRVLSRFTRPKPWNLLRHLIY